MAADGGCERDVVHRMNEGYRAWGALKRCGATEDWDRGKEVSISRSNSINCVVRSRGTGYEKC